MARSFVLARWMGSVSMPDRVKIISPPQLKKILKLKPEEQQVELSLTTIQAIFK